MATVNIELNNKPVKGSQEHKLQLRITVDREKARVTLMWSVLPTQFNPNGKRSNYIRANHPNHKVLNNKIEDKIQQAKDIISDLEKKSKPYTAGLVKQLMLKPVTVDFVKFTEREIEELKNTNRIGSSKKYSVVLNTIKDYAKTDILGFDQISPEFLRKYESYLLKQGLKQISVHGYINKIRALINKSIQQGRIDPGQNPFLIYKLKQGKSLKDRLTLEEIIKIEELELTPGTLISHVRNEFLFSFYNAGIRISDLLMLIWGNIQNGRLVYKMYKTNRIHSLLLKEKPLAILRQYQTDDTKKEDYIFPFFKNNIDYSDPLFLHNQIGSKTALINKYLKEIAKKAEIEKNITTHTARHSFADFARKKIDNIYNLSKTLGHSSIKVTEAYLATFDEKAVDETLNSIFDQ